MLYQFEHEKFNVCGDCPLWHPNTVSWKVISNTGVCCIDFEERDRFDDKPSGCPLAEVEGIHTCNT